jgi:mono/diheme cytochrome c family protein
VRRALLRGGAGLDTVKCMKTIGYILTLVFAVAVIPVGWATEQTERGKYLVEEVGKCQECHTPRGADGKLDREKWLKGAVLDFQPIQPVKDWHKTSADLTPGSRLWQKWGERGITAFLKTGLGPSGHSADPPMPTYKLKAEDAEAIVQYLKSLK